MDKGFYPTGGLWDKVFGTLYSFWGENRWSNIEDARAFKSLTEVKHQFRFRCDVQDEYFSEAPDYRFRVRCR